MSEQDNNNTSFDPGNVSENSFAPTEGQTPSSFQSESTAESIAQDHNSPLTTYTIEDESLTGQEQKEKSPIFKKWWFWVAISVVVIIVIAVAVLYSSGNTSNQDSTPSNTVKRPTVTQSTKNNIQFAGIRLDIDSAWRRDPDEENLTMYYYFIEGQDAGVPFFVIYSIGVPYGKNTEAALLQFSDTLTSTFKDQFENGEGELIFSGIEEFNEIIGYRTQFSYTTTSNSGRILHIYVDDFTAIINENFVSLRFYISNEDRGKYEKIIQSVYDSLHTVSGKSNPLAVEESVAPPPTPDPTPPPTVTATRSQENAVKKAKEYLNFMAFSRQGLIEQLEYEGFSNEDAVYGVDHVVVNWNAQAAKKANDYLDMMSFSRQGLIDQLLFEGFTYEEATYGVDLTGL